MHLKTLVVHNVLGIKHIEVNLEGHHLWLLGGKNRAGKTSALRALVMALCGKKNNDWPDAPVRLGQSEGYVRVTMDGDEDIFQNELRIEQAWIQDGDGYKETFQVLGDGGFEAPEPRTLLNRLYKHRCLSPLAFRDLEQKAQIDELQSYVGLDFTGLNARAKMLYDQRTSINRQVKKAKQLYEDAPHHDDAPEAKESVAELTSEWGKRRSFNEETRGMARGLAGLKDREAALTSDAEGIIATIEETARRLAQQKNLLEKAQAEVLENGVKINELDAQIKERPTENEEEIRDQISQVEETNKKIDANNDRQHLHASWQDAKKRSDGLTEKMQDCEASKSKQLDEAKWPVEGLRFTDDGLVLNGIPFSQCSQAEQIVTSIKMAMAAAPKLRLLLIEHGECMDNETLIEVASVAAKNDYKLLVEYMTRTEEDEAVCAIVLEDGVVKVPEEKEEKQPAT